MTETNHHIKGNGLQETHHLYVLANEPQDGQGCVGHNGGLGGNVDEVIQIHLYYTNKSNH